MFGHHAPGPVLPATPIPSTMIRSGNAMARVAGLLGLSLMLLAGTAAYAASAWDSVKSEKAPPLPNDGLAEQDHDTLDKVMVRPGVNLAGYGKVMLAPIGLAVERRFDEVLLSNRDRDHAIEYLTEKLQKAMGPALVDQAGPGVLKLEITFTDYVPNRAYNARKASGTMVDRVYSVGSAAFQAVIRDSQSGQVLATIADADMGLPFPDNVNTYTFYGDADRFSSRWAKQLTKLLVPAANQGS